MVDPPPKGPRTAAVMLVYNHVPDFASLDLAGPHVERVVLIDNASRPEVAQQLEKFQGAHPGGVQLVQNSRNLGISKAYNQVVGELAKVGIQRIYLLDHDAKFDGTLFTETQRTWEDLERRGARIGMIVPIVSDDETLLHSDLGFRQPTTTLKTVITSGILTTVKTFQAVGGFDERLFVEAADFAFAGAVERTGAHIYRVNKVLIVQKFEKTPQGHSLPLRLANFMIRTRSRVRVGIGNANIFRTKVSYYVGERRGNMYANVRKVGEENRSLSSNAFVIVAMNRLEEIYVRNFLSREHGD